MDRGRVKVRVMTSLLLAHIDILRSSKFTFKNPNVKDACGCGESFTVSQ